MSTKTKETRFLQTIGIKDLQENFKIEHFSLEIMFLNCVNNYFLKSYFVTFEQTENGVLVTDANNKKLDLIKEISIPEKIWIIQDDYGDYYTATALLPSEY